MLQLMASPPQWVVTFGMLKRANEAGLNMVVAH
jgi:hypothetical protein